MTRTCCALLVAVLAAAAPPALAEDGRFLQLDAGIGLSFEESAEVDGGGSGAYARADYLFSRDEWFTPKLYAGFLFTRPERDCGVGVAPCDVSAQIAFVGAAGRLMLPIPYFGPFVELGLGASVGQIATRIGTLVDVQWSGATYHVPWAVGVAFGSRRQYELAFQYMEHPEQRQTNGAVAVGFGFRIGPGRDPAAEQER